MKIFKCISYNSVRYTKAKWASLCSQIFGFNGSFLCKNYITHNPQVNRLPVQEFVNNERRYEVVKRSHLKILPCTGHNNCILYVTQSGHTRED